jgi:hypothetical protein
MGTRSHGLPVQRFFFRSPIALASARDRDSPCDLAHPPHAVYGGVVRHMHPGTVTSTMIGRAVFLSCDAMPVSSLRSNVAA